MYNISILMNTYNEDNGILKQAIDSYLGQTNVNVQLIISTIEGDKSIEYIKNTYNDNRITFAILPKSEHPGRGHVGIYTQLNNALQYIKYEWVSYASSNDVALLTKSYDEIKLCLSTNKQICYSAFYVTSTDLKKRQLKKFYQYDYDKHLKGNFVTDCATISTKLLNKYMPFKLEYHNHAYWDLWLRIYEGEGNVFIYSSTPAFLYRTQTLSISTETRKNSEKRKINEQYRKFMLDNHHK